MTIQEKINADLRSAMVSKNEFNKSILRVVIGEFNRIDKIVPDEKATAIIKKMVENAKLVGNEFEVTFLEGYLPKQLSEAELKNVIEVTIESNGYTIKDMGKIMGELKTNYAGQYDGKLATELIKATFTARFHEHS